MTRHILAAAIVAAAITPVGTATTFASGQQCGGASWYGPGFNGRPTASGQTFNQNAMTAAHKTLPFGTVVKVVDQRTGKSVRVTINDRGPYHRGRIIDLSKAAAGRLGFQASGTTRVCITAV